MDSLFRYTLTFLIGTVAAFQFVQVITRYILQTPVMGLEEMAMFPTLWLYIMGSVNASREDTQIRANVLEIFLKTDRAKRILAIIAEVLSLVISTWLTWWAWDYFRYSLRVWKESPTLYIPTFYFECALFLGLAVMTLYVCKHLLRNVKLLIAGSAETATVEK
jgi:TRAP-type C4-dicarboxylate transport system permease small subunit